MNYNEYVFLNDRKEIKFMLLNFRVLQNDINENTTQSQSVYSKEDTTRQTLY